MISDALPKGWKLYVKEHPHQFRLKNYFAYMLKTIPYYKTEGFYKQILQFDNVELIDLSISSQELIMNAQATATICGTTAIESIINKKPLILFGENLTPLGKVNDVFKISSQDGLNSAVKAIGEDFKPNYDDLDDILSNYVYVTGAQEISRIMGVKDFLVDIHSALLKNV